MSGQYDNNMRFTLFKNKKKVPGDTKPEYTGKIEIDGVVYWLSAWVKTPNAGGEKFMSGTVRHQDETTTGAPSARSQTPIKDKLTNRPPPSNPIPEQQEFKEDDIPF